MRDYQKRTNADSGRNKITCMFYRFIKTWNGGKTTKGKKREKEKEWKRVKRVEWRRREKREKRWVNEGVREKKREETRNRESRITCSRMASLQQVRMEIEEIEYNMEVIEVPKRMRTTLRLNRRSRGEWRTNPTLTYLARPGSAHPNLIEPD